LLSPQGVKSEKQKNRSMDKSTDPNAVQMKSINDFIELLYICKNMVIIYEKHPALHIEYKDNRFQMSLQYMERNTYKLITPVELLKNITRYNNYNNNHKIISRVEMNCSRSTVIVYGNPYNHEMKYFDCSCRTVYWEHPSFKECLMIDSFAC
jgi:hypothetical protein